jgi:hypothetical protein
MIKGIVPLEDVEQADYVSWLNDRGIKHFRVPSETYTKSKAQKAKNKRLGVVRGIQDLFVIITPEQSVDAEGYILASEMKRIKGSKTTPEQWEWYHLINSLGIANVHAYIFKGAAEAKYVTKRYLKPELHGVSF